MHQLGSCCTVNGAVNPAASKQRRIGCIDDGIYRQGGNVGSQGMY